MRFAAVVLMMLLGQIPAPQFKISDLEKRIFDLVNQQRAKAGVPILKVDPKLTRIARAHSELMASEKFFAHVDPSGKGPTERGKAVGYTCRRQTGNVMAVGIAENIFQNNTYSSVVTIGERKSYNMSSEEEIAETTVNGWMDSPGHRANILDAEHLASGLGIALAADGKILVTQDFC